MMEPKLLSSRRPCPDACRMKKPATPHADQPTAMVGVAIRQVSCVMHVNNSCKRILTQAGAAALHDALADDPDLHALVASQKTPCGRRYWSISCSLH